MNITSEYPVMVFINRKDGKPSYSIGMSKKVEEDGETKYQNAYIPCRFKKGIEPELNKTKIRLVNAFLTFSQYQDEEGKTKTFQYIMVTDYSEIEEQKQTTSIKQDEIEINEDDLPF